MQILICYLAWHSRRRDRRKGRVCASLNLITCFFWLTKVWAVVKCKDVPMLKKRKGMVDFLKSVKEKVISASAESPVSSCGCKYVNMHHHVCVTGQATGSQRGDCVRTALLKIRSQLKIAACWTRKIIFSQNQCSNPIFFGVAPSSVAAGCRMRDSHEPGVDASFWFVWCHPAGCNFLELKPKCFLFELP